MLSKMHYTIEDPTANQAERTLLLAHPAGFIELTDAELAAAAGGLAGLGTVFLGPLSGVVWEALEGTAW